MTDTNNQAPLDIAAYWEFRMATSQHADYTKPDTSLAQFQALPVAAASSADLLAYASAAMTKFLAIPISFNVNAGTSAASLTVLSDGTYSTRTDLSLLGLYGQANPTGTKQWMDNNGTVTVLTGTQLVELTTLVGSWIADCYAALATLNSKISGSSPSITTTAQIDAYTWPQS